MNRFKQIVPAKTFIPVTTLHSDRSRFPLDDLVRPFLFRVAPIALVSFLYAGNLSQWDGVTFLDSGGFAGSDASARYEPIDGGEVRLVLPDSSSVSPSDLLALAEKSPNVKVVASLDAFIVPELEAEEASRRFHWSIENARWLVQNRVRQDLAIVGSLQSWDRASAERGAALLAEAGVDAVGLGGMVPRRTRPEFWEMVEGALAGAAGLPVHVFGVGAPNVVRQLFDRGVWSVDSSSYLRQAIGKRYWHPLEKRYVEISQLTASLPCSCPLCRLDVQSFQSSGLWGTSRLALHNVQQYK